MFTAYAGKWEINRSNAQTLDAVPAVLERPYGQAPVPGVALYGRGRLLVTVTRDEAIAYATAIVTALDQATAATN